MLRNLELTGGLVFSGQLLLELAEAGMSREDAYKLVQGHAMAAWNDPDPNAPTYKERIAADPTIQARLSPEKLAHAFDFRRQLTNIDQVFERVLAEG